MQTKRNPISIIIFLVGGILIVLTQILLTRVPADRRTGLLILEGLGFILVFAGIWFFDRGIPGWMGRILTWFNSHSISDWQFGCLLLSIPLVVVVPFAAGGEASMLNPIAAILAWLTAITLVVAGSISQPYHFHKPGWRTWAIFTGILAIAFLIRAIFVGSIPIRLSGDEASAGIAAAGFFAGKWNNIFSTSWFSFPSLFFAIPGISIDIFGHTIEALRFPSAMAGALTVVATFFAARAMFGKRTAWFAAIFLAAFHFHNHFSRIGLNNIWDGLWYVVTIAAFWVGWEKDNRNAFVVAGLSLGISQYFYTSSHSLLLLVIGWILVSVIFDRRTIKKAWISILLMMFVAGIVAIPLIWHYIKFHNTFFEPMNRVAMTSSWLTETALRSGTTWLNIMYQQFVKAIGAFTFEPLRVWYTPGVPLLRPLPAALFIIGLILLFLRKRKWQIIPITLWLLLFIFIGAFSMDTPASQRYVAAAPVCALLVGLGLGESTELVGSYFSKGKRWIEIIAILIIAFLALDELNFYFRVYTPLTRVSMAHSNDVFAQRLADFLQGKPADTQVIFFASPNMGYYSVSSIQYLNPGIKGADVDPPWSLNDNSEITSKHVVFVFPPEEVDQIQQVQEDFPGGTLTSVPAVDGKLLFNVYEVSTR
jgi:4-amino-4-deoxy-L-arabinose transferase-like glycosyltransferase